METSQAQNPMEISQSAEKYEGNPSNLSKIASKQRNIREKSKVKTAVRE